LAVTVIGVILCYYIPAVALFWIVFSVYIGQTANNQVAKALRKRGFSQIGEFHATDADLALSIAQQKDAVVV
jgi:hypothetical protein